MSIRSTVAAAAATLGLVTAVVATSSGPAQAALPRVDMARVLAAAQVEPRCGQRAGLSDNASTTLVQRALAARGISTTADGWYGNGTTSSYAAWQRRLGYSGIDANGLPGTGSLTRLGTNRFTVSHPVTLGSRTDTYGGKRVNTRTRLMLAAADARVPFAIRLTQGSYNPGGSVPPPAPTTAVGSSTSRSPNLTTTQRWQLVRALRTVGFAAWLRTPRRGSATTCTRWPSATRTSGSATAATSPATRCATTTRA